MRKLIILLFCVTTLQSRAQYFIPVFDNQLKTVFSCDALVADTIHHLLYVAASRQHYSPPPLVDTSYLYIYTNGKLKKIGPTKYDDNYGKGTLLPSGKVCIVNSYNTDNYFYTLDSTKISNCYGSVCYENGFFDCIKSVNDTIYIGGLIGEFQNTNCYQIGGIDNSGNAFPLGLGVTSSGYDAQSLEYFKGELYAGGFKAIDYVPVNAIARWNGLLWRSVGSGLTGGTNNHDVSVMKEYNGKLYVGGGFDSAGGVFCKGIARWTGTNWENLQEFKKVNSDFYDMEVYHNRLYMLGNFDDYDSGTNTFTYVTGFFQYDGINLKHFNVGDRLVSRGTSMEVFNDTLFISGRFDSLGYLPAKHLVKFVDGTFSTYAPVTTKWWYNSSAEGQQQPNSCYKYYEVARDTFVMNTPPTSGYNCRKIKAEQYLPDKTHTALQPLYVFGDTNRIMYYNNYQKRFVEGYRFNVKVGDTLTYYTPQPQSAGDTTFRVIVDSITTLTVQTEKLKRVYTTPLDGWSFGSDGYAQLIGGLASMLPQPISYFTNEGPLLCYQDTSIYFKYFTGGVSCNYAVSTTRSAIVNSQSAIYPNPNTGRFHLSLNQLPEGEVVTAELYNVQGSKLYSKVIAAGANHVLLDIPESVPEGIHFLRLSTSKDNIYTKIIIQRP